ncbi:unnamed protein product [Orchesella dallaii]|uniref:Uncharacterized protein n=1 Tax=Orchesella dallaii TaxID=48710 RepID=A0ABP1RZK2_9HEXA
MSLLIIGTILSSSGHPAQRRTLTLVDRLMRANPLRNLAKYFGQKLSLNVYYPEIQPPQPRPGPSMQQTHYVKVPMWQPLYYPPQVAMIPPLVHQGQQQGPQVVHGFSYPVHQPMVQPPVSLYKPVITDALPPNQGYYMGSSPNNQVSANEIVYQYGNDLPEDDSNSAGNMVRIIVIQPSTDLEKMKSMRDSELMNGYTMKYIEVDDTDQDSVTSHTQIIPQHDTIRLSQNTTCVEPLCDPFLRKLIPELFPTSATSIAQVVFPSQYLGNNQTQKLQELQDTSENSDDLENESSEEDEEVMMIKAIQEPNLHVTSQFEPSPPTHKKAISARINSTSLRKYEPKGRQLQNAQLPLTDKVHQNVHKLTHNHLVKSTMLSRPDGELIPSQTSTHFESPPIYPMSMQNYHIQASYPPPRYGTSMSKQRMAHYTAGVVFNKPN